MCPLVLSGTVGVAVHRGPAAFGLLADPSFREQWADLAAACPWASVFQSGEYLGAWYRTYAEVSEPLLVLEFDRTGTLDAMLALAVCRRDDSLILAGRPHAEYYGWLSRRADGLFLERALSTLQPSFPDAVLDFRYLPPGSPTPQWADTAWAGRVLVEEVPRPLIDLRAGPPRFAGGHKSKWNRLTRRGDVEFQEVADTAALGDDLDAIVAFCDFRQAAADRLPPFRSDPRKLPFYKALFGCPGLLHATVLRVGGRAIAAHIGYRNGGEVSLGVLAHSPFFNRYSPGALHLLLLARLLAEQGIDRFDLTPQGSYKERFATSSDAVTRLTVHFSQSRFTQRKHTDALLRAGRRGLGMLSLTPDRAREAFATLQHVRRQAWRGGTPSAAWKAFRAAMGWPGRVRTFRHDGRAVPDLPGDTGVQRDSLDHLLAYTPFAPHQPPRGAFLRQTMRRLELIEGDSHVYTAIEDGALVVQGWMHRRPQSDGTMPAGCVVLDGLESHPREAAQRLRACVTTMLRDATSSDAAPIFAVVRATDLTACEVLRELGFTEGV